MKQSVLVIEDEQAIADNIVYALQIDGFDVHHVITAGAGMEWFANNDVHLLILDIGLPDANGFELCKQIRAKSDVPIIFLTARTAEIDRIVGLEIGADDYVTKPFSPRELSARVKAILRRGTFATAKSADHALFHHEPDKCQISYYGETLLLSRYEYRILKILISRPGNVYSRDQLLTMAWEDPGISMDRTIDSHIKMLRGKLRSIRADQDPIQTHRGLGYSIKEI